jgi:hypothetical protein
MPEKSAAAFIYSIRVEDGHIAKDKYGLVIKHPNEAIEILYFWTSYDRARFFIEHNFKRVPLRGL